MEQKSMVLHIASSNHGKHKQSPSADSQEEKDKRDWGLWLGCLDNFLNIRGRFHPEIWFWSIPDCTKVREEAHVFRFIHAPA